MNDNGFPFARKARDLLLELKRSSWIPIYNEANVRDVINEINELHSATEQLQQTASTMDRRHETSQEAAGISADKENADVVNVSTSRAQDDVSVKNAEEAPGAAVEPSIAFPCLLFHHSILRSRRCLMSYLTNRVDKLTKSRFEIGSVLPRDMQSKLSKSERQFLNEYNSLIDNYIATIDSDITTSLVPPKELMLEVRGLEDCGEVFTESGPVIIQRGSYYYLKRADVENLVKQSLVEQVAKK